MGFCRRSSMDYTEVRLGSGNWESVNMNEYLVQILLSELMDVPTSIEGGEPDVNINLYQENSNFDFWNVKVDVFRHPEMSTAGRVDDCRMVTTDPENYEPCYHVYPEIWWQSKKDLPFPEMESLLDLGVLSTLAIYIPKFALQRDTSLNSFIGLRGEDNRRKLAETFKSPTRWGDYCKEVSPTNCTIPDPIAERAPLEEDEEMLFFSAGVYNGHFRMTQDCDANPECAGDFINIACDWTTYALQQIYHNDIALEMRGPLASGGYSYDEQVQIYAAANATKEAVMVLMYDTDTPYSEWLGTDAEMTRVNFAPPTQKCFDSRITSTDTCNPDATPEQLYGSPDGACDTSAQALKKMLSYAFHRITIGDDIAEEFQSPAYEAFQSYQISELSYSEIFQMWKSRGTDPWGYDLRDAVCQFFVQNLDVFQAFVPESHPRVVVEAETSKTSGLMEAALGIAAVAVILVIVSLLVAFRKRKTKVLYHTQNEFLNLILSGMLIVSIGAILLTVAVADWTCALLPWVINLGWVLQLVPLYCRISGISELATSGKQMERVRLNIKWLCTNVAVVAFVLVAFLVTWVLLDTPEKTFEYEMSTDKTPQGETIIMAYPYCGSVESYWIIPVFGWRALLVIPSCMIAVLASRVKEDLNDTHTMSKALYTHAVSLSLEVICFLGLYGSSNSDLMGYTSVIFSTDTIVSLAVYVVPKFLNSGQEVDDEPLPDVFVHTTIALLEVDGFTAWSSVREPVQVFQFLEQLYGYFDKLAEKHGVYKIQTVSELYISATGIPTCQGNHCILMASFAIDCLKKMPKVVKNMEVHFGPDTSGPVTGGFLKGKGERFQIVGDTVTTAQLIQKHSLRNRIHLSQATAELLIQANKRAWVMEREDPVDTEEKGTMKTYWLVKGSHREYDMPERHSCYESIPSDEAEDDIKFSKLKNEERWVEFNVETFKGLLKQIIARRDGSLSNLTSSNHLLHPSRVPEANMPLEEVKEVIMLPSFDKRAARRQLDFDKVEIQENVVFQLREYISIVASCYNDNPFHNFAHASYVVMAIKKYMNRIIAASEMDVGHAVEERVRSSVQAAIHSHTYGKELKTNDLWEMVQLHSSHTKTFRSVKQKGITSDPLTQFACVFSALIHDVDHPGVPNPQLVREDKEVAERFKARSVAEQKSFVVSWNLLMEERFSALLSTICSTPKELQRFRQLVINSVMATDLGDKQLKELRNGRWEKAFATSDESSSLNTGGSSDTLSSCADLESGRERTCIQINRKATIVIEHLIQAADVAHMSQHWAIYRKWNRLLFREMYKAWREGRAEHNPAEDWYKGEIGFFDFYIVPLSRKLRDCGVFGPTSDENYNYATNNRNMWVQEGQGIVKVLLAEVEMEYSKMPEMYPGDDDIERAFPLVAGPSIPTPPSA
ncbi:Receptor-type guanylate cyclase gcy [Seminavis robusta]|uniref:Receptor-type guanylate cyclase gcy n=1 Tax=Seminavis robusta TaxID=568900 RepID=A0A9N8HDE6_9STRA|nr:Receptor-type guanylate cyclase gcy [Seminavis robusta]|eukprot:Sro456_g146760.1 Receptor-type guanylate cyclase gcy (1403) ;mRNA; f:58157-63869